MHDRLRYLLALVAAVVGVSGCPARDPQESAEKSTASAAATADKPEQPAKPQEVVFDPKNPPPGWVLCHRNHCHHQDGRIASYQQVMQEIGATRIVGEEAPKAAPPAPPNVDVIPKDAVVTESGLATLVLKAGVGTKKPSPTSVVTVHYTGWTTDGKAFDSSIARGTPAQFPVNRVIAGWTEGLQLMVEGEERRFWIPVDLAYRGSPGKPMGTLVFDVELISIRD